eukprot:TRINITY_DN404_c0_g1_i1.p1 TRINITY_DN404_c0_g1~~TRINITY_DN404_c0_g1_i1.p1  ORF type:complete len:394 (-),score=153.42 TRINITY_DN404_c0_g1_i1:503-1684(-)
MAVKKRGNTKTPPILSHEFVIQNHADIVACFAMIFVVGFMFQSSSPAASLFIGLHHNVSVPAGSAPAHLPASPSGEVTLYRAGLKDLCGIFFYFLISIVMHAILQEYLLDKMNRKLHMSKSKHAKFNESGQLLAFVLASLVWAGDLLLREFPPSVRSLWEGYPHANMSFSLKFFFIVQLAYWLHTFPDLYFHKVKREDIPERVARAGAHILLLAATYVLSLNRLALTLLALQYGVQALFHAARLLHYAEKLRLSESLFATHDLFFVLARLGSIILTVLTFWYGLPLAPLEEQGIDLAKGNFNTPLLRLTGLLIVCLLQAWLMWNFITLQLKLKREKSIMSGSTASGEKKSRSRLQQEKAAKRKERQISKKEQEDLDDLPEVDQAASKTIRQRK